MRRPGWALLASLFVVVLTLPLSAQEGDPSEIFLKAYLSAQQGEKLEGESRFKTALAKFRFAGSLIEELRRSHSDWQPAIVEYRGRKIGEGILRVQERMSRQNELSAAASRLPEIVPSLPDSEGWSEPGPEVVAPQGLDTISPASGDAAIEDATRKLRRKIDQLQAALEKSRGHLETARKEKEAASTRLQETNSKLENVQKEIETSKEAEHKVRDQLAQTQASFKALQASKENDATEQLRTQIADLKNEVAVAEEARAIAEKQRDEANVKLAEATEQIAAVGQQRDEALAQLKVASESGKGHELGEEDSANMELAGVKEQIAQLQQQLADSQKQNQYLVARIAELSVQLDETGAQLQHARLAGKNGEETDRLLRENELLRNIVVRERQEEARRHEVRRLMLAELNKLKNKSDALNSGIEFLAQPVIKLSSEELTLLRQPVVSVSDENRGVLTASFIFAKKSGGDSAEGEPTMNNSGQLKGDVRNDPQSVAHATTKESLSDAANERLKPVSVNPGQGSE